MTTPTVHLPLLGTLAGFRRFSVDEYHKLIELGFLTEDDDLELLDGYLVHKMSRNPPHDAIFIPFRNRAPRRGPSNQTRREPPARW